MSSLTRLSATSCRSQENTPHAHSLTPPSDSQLSPFPTTFHYDDWDPDDWGPGDEEEHDQDSDDEFLLGFSARTIALGSSQDTEDDIDLPTPPSSLPENIQIQADDLHEDTFLDSFPPSSHPDLVAKSLTTNTHRSSPPHLSLPSLPLPSSPAVAELADDEDDGAFLARLMKQQEQMRKNELAPALPQSLPNEPSPEPMRPDVVRGNDPLELFYSPNDNNSDVEMEDECAR